MAGSSKRTVTFVPEVPTRPDLSDTGYGPGATYTVVLRATLPPAATGSNFDVTLTATSVGYCNTVASRGTCLR